ncbi:MAG: YIP1 family protein [Candidatus Eisenbacteria bacterium]
MSFVDYIKKGWEAAQLKTDTIKELAADEKGIGPAIGILAISGLAAGIGLFNPASALGFPFVWVIGGFILVAVMHFVATTFFGGKGKLTSLAVPAFCASLITCVGIVPFIGPLFLIHLAFLWLLVVMVISVENVYGIDRGKAIGVVAIPVVLFFIVGMMLVAMGVGLMAATGAFSS